MLMVWRIADRRNGQSERQRLLFLRTERWGHPCSFSLRSIADMRAKDRLEVLKKMKELSM
jgi:hypothetical protein